MKYIFLLALFTFGGDVSAVVAPGQGSPNTVSSFGGGSVDSGSIGGGNTDSGSLGGGNTDSGSIGGSAAPGASYDANNNYTGGNPGTPAIGKPAATIPGFIGWVVQVMNYLVVAMMTLALLFFLYGVFMLMFVGGANEDSRSKGKKFMLWGILSLFVMVSVWGLVALLKNSLFGGGELMGPQFK